MDSTRCPICLTEETGYSLRLYTDNERVCQMFPELTDNSHFVVLQQEYCYPHYVEAYQFFAPVGGIEQQWKHGYVGQFNPREGLLPA